MYRRGIRDHTRSTYFILTALASERSDTLFNISLTAQCSISLKYTLNPKHTLYSLADAQKTIPDPSGINCIMEHIFVNCAFPELSHPFEFLLNAHQCRN